MKTSNEDPGLEFELQEVYLSSKQWLSDLAFLEEETNFLDEQLSGPHQLAIAAAVRDNLAARLENARKGHDRIGIKLAHFIKRLEPLLLRTDPVPDLQLVEEFIALQTAIRDALSILKGIKYALVEAHRMA